jgi:hypothetical protein
MKLWEAMQILKSYQRLRSKDTGNVYELGVDVLFPVINGEVSHIPCSLAKQFFKGDYEIIPKWDHILSVKCPNCGHEFMGVDWTDEDRPKFTCVKCALKLAVIN